MFLGELENNEISNYFLYFNVIWNLKTSKTTRLSDTFGQFTLKIWNEKTYKGNGLISFFSIIILNKFNFFNIYLESRVYEPVSSWPQAPLFDQPLFRQEYSKFKCLELSEKVLTLFLINSNEKVK